MARLRDEHGISLELVRGFEQGETRAAHLVRSPDGGEWVLKWAPASPDAEANLRRLVRLVERLRSTGYPVPRHLAVGVLDPVAYWIQERLPGEPPDRASVPLVAARLVELADLHAGIGDLADPPWPAPLVRTLEVGGDGCCLHETMLGRPDTTRMLEEIKEIAATCQQAPVRRHDITHFDVSYANVLTDGGSITGVIDWTMPFAGGLQGDRSFDIATLLFYAHDLPPTRDLLCAALLDRCDPRSAALFLAHPTRRQVEWVVRFHPGTPTHDRFLALGRNVLDDLAALLG